MRIIKSVLSGVVLAGMVMGATAARADDVSNAPQAVSFTNGAGATSGIFAGNTPSATFVDTFSFSTSTLSNVFGSITSFTDTAFTGLNITGVSIVDSSLNVYKGTKVSTGALDLWTYSATNLAAGSYYLLVAGNLASTGSASFGGNINVTAVPEPESYAMFMAGLGLIGVVASRRRKVTSVAA